MKLSVRSSNAKQRRVIARAIACSILLILPSCGIPNLRHPEPGAGLPPGFDAVTNSGPDQPAGLNAATSLENSAQLGIDEFFHDPTLTRLIEHAVAGNQELKALNEEVQIARNEILARQGAYLPFLGFRSSVGLDKPSIFTPLGAAEKDLEYLPGKHFPDPLPNYLLGLDFFWQLDIWRELRNARDAAGQRYLAASERRNYFVTRLVADVAENYYGLMALDKRLETLDRTIELQQQSYELAKAKKEAGRGTELAVQRFQAEVRKNQSEKLIVRQDIVEAENRINFLAGRFPQPVERMSAGFFDLNIHMLSVGVPAQLLLNRADIRQAERELEAAGLDVKVARAHFFPRLDITGGVGYQAFNPKYLFWTPDALIGNIAGDLVVPLINKKAIKAEYLSANARQLQSVYNYQRVILNAFTEVVNRVSMAENYRRSIEIKKQQLESLEASVDVATKLFQNARAEYVEVLLAQRDLLEARTVLIETKRQQLSAIVNAYQALGGGWQILCQNATAQGSPVPPMPGAGPDTLPAPSAPDSDETLPSPRRAPAPPDKDAQQTGS
jgi:NodT family efflux transporter outer membrane factor (OMF) lipoprotein